jgi:3'(2'), 5'-bisphosphate nucleotidase
MEWDTAAGQAILEAAGGWVEDLSGQPLRYCKPKLRNEGFLGWGRRPSGIREITPDIEKPIHITPADQ